MAACICVAVVHIHLAKKTLVSHKFSNVAVILFCTSDDPDPQYIEQYDVNFFQRLIAQDDKIIGKNGLQLTPEQREYIFGKSTTEASDIPIEVTDKITDFLTEQRKESENFRNNIP